MKVARELKYFVPETNYSALERELSGTRYGSEAESAPADPRDDSGIDHDEELAKWSEYLEADADDDAEDDERGARAVG